MGKRKIILYDDNFDYIQRLASFIENDKGITVGIFTSLEKLEDYIGGESEDFYVLQDCEDCRQLYSKTGIHGVLITDKKELEDAGIYEYVYRYRAARDITDIIMSKMNCESKEETKERETVKTYAITSPVYRADIDNMLIEISKSTTKKVLVIDFRLITAWEDICDREESTNLSDILFLIRDCSYTFIR